MPESGGPTTQSGILYQNSVTALYLGRLCDATSRPDSQRVIHVRVEAPEHVDDTVVTFADEHITYIQAKENIAGSDSEWVKLWQNFGKQFQCKDFQIGKDRLLFQIGNFREEHDELRGLCERASTSKSYNELEGRSNKKQKSLLEKIKSHLPLEFFDGETPLRFFAHLDIEILTLTQIERDAAPYWMPETSMERAILFRLLRDRVSGAGRIRGSFEAYKLRKQLEDENPALQFITPLDIEKLRNSLKSASSLLRQHHHTIATTGIHIIRDVVVDIVTWVRLEGDNSKNVAMLIDQAGMGKTVVMRDVLCELENLSIDTLAIKSDLQLANTSSFSDIQQQLELDHSVLETVERLAKQNRVVVLIDQVDALSLSLARDQRTLNVVFDFLARLRQIANVRIIISCRKFDINNDPRLQQLTFDENFVLEKFSDQELEIALTPLNVQFLTLPKPTQELIRTPLHLNLFGLVIESNRHFDVQGINSVQELYNRIWYDVVRKNELNAPLPADREKVLYILTDYMYEHQKTSVPYSVLETPDTVGLHQAIQWLASVGILIHGRGEWSLLHQTFFDYCYARHFVARGQDIVAEILKSEQGLFVRPQLIQVLSYLRGTNHKRYIQSINNFLTDSRLRYHLRFLLLQWFGALITTTDDEWLVARRMLLDPARQRLLLTAMYGNRAWFDRINATYLQNWLSNDELVDMQVFPYLVSLVDIIQAQIITLIEPFWRQSEQWLQRTGLLLSSIRHWHTIEAIDLFEQYIYQLPTVKQIHFYEVLSVAQVHPPTGCRIVRHILDRAFDVDQVVAKQADDEPTHIYVSFYEKFHSLDQSQLDEVIKLVSQTEPRLFVDLIVPWLEKVLLLNQPSPPNLQDYYFLDTLSHNFHDDIFEIKYALIHGLITALTTIAEIDPGYFRECAESLASLPYSTPQMLLACAYQAIPEIYAQDAYEFLIADQRRLNLGNASQRESRLLIASIYPHLCDIHQTRLERHILAYAPLHKHMGVEGLRWRGIEQLVLLKAIPKQYLSMTGIRKLQEWERKFPHFTISDEPYISEFRKVGPPISSESAQKMSDKSWLRAMQKYQGKTQHKEFLRGGAHELSGILSTLVKDDPQRFHDLLAKVPDDLDDAYVSAFINGFSELPAPAEWLYSVVERFAIAPERDLKRTLAWALKKRVDEGIPDKIIDILLSYLDDEPGDDEWWWSKDKNNGDIYNNYLNSDRGSSYHTLMRIFDRQDSLVGIERKWMLIERACSDKSTALRAGAINELIYMIQYDRQRAILCYQQLIHGHELLLTSHHNREFLYWGLHKNFTVLLPYIGAMLNHSDKSIQQQGAELICISALSSAAFESVETHQVAEQMVENIMMGPSAWRRGAARIYAHNISRNISYDCLSKVMRLLGDDDKDVRQSIEHIFGSLKEEHFFTLRPLIEAYIRSGHVPEHHCMKYLWEHGLLDPPWALSMVLSLVEQVQSYPPGSFLSGIDELIRLVLQIYNNPMSDSALRHESMDVFDMLMERFSGRALQILSEWDSR